MRQLKLIYLGQLWSVGLILLLFGLTVRAETNSDLDLRADGDKESDNHVGPMNSILLNEIQLIGSHNSFKKNIDSTLLFILGLLDNKIAAGLDYAHLPLTEQLQLGLRSLELDVFYDPEGGLYRMPLGSRLGPFSSEYDADEVMKESGFKVMHVQDVDYRSHCLTLKICLEQIQDWSNRNPRHLPLIITINPKDEIIPQAGFVQPLPFTADTWESLDAEFIETLSKFIVTPDDIRGSRKTLKESILAGWPSVDSLRGKVIFVLDASAPKIQDYVASHPELKGRVMFVNLPEESSMASFRIVNDPIANLDYIKKLVLEGFIVRTRADADTVESRSGDDKRLKAAIDSGAQVISTDYYEMDLRHGTSFEVRLQDASFFGCNHLLTSETCQLQE
jgi:hypothetical protein